MTSSVDDAETLYAHPRVPLGRLEDSVAKHLRDAADSIFAGAPEEFVFETWAQGAHSFQLGYLQALRELPGYLSSVFK
jgi:hypothetical protein